MKKSPISMDEILDFAPCGFISLDEEGNIVLVNSTLCKLLKYEANELMGKKLEDILSVGGRMFYQTHFYPLLVMQGHIEEIYFSLHARAGEDVPVLVNAVRRTRADGEFFDCILVPMVQRNRYENELLEARRAAQEANQAKDDFLAVVSHELRTPLNAIMGWAQLVREGVDAATLDQAMEVIDRSGRAQVQIIEDILDIARLRGGKLQIERQSVIFADLLQEAVDSMAPAMRAQSLTLELEISEETRRAPILGDSGRLRQIALNLLSNAIKFTPRGGKIGVCLDSDGTQLQCAIFDNGQGIAPALLPRVFDRFSQGDSSSTRRTGGLGLGLALVQSLVEMHGGRIEAASQGEGFGATFTVCLPLLEAEV